MRSFQTSFVIAYAGYVTIFFVFAHRIDALLSCRILYAARNGYNASVPVILYCVGKGSHGNWSKIDNGTDRLIARFNMTTVDRRDHRYNITTLARKKNGTLETILTFTRGDNGTFKCAIGNATRILRVPMLIKAGGTWNGLNVSLQCTPLNKNLSDPDHIGRYPYNITWFLNSTIVGRVEIYNDTSYNVTYNTNSSFVQLKNVTLHNNWGHTNTTRPVCLTCLVNESGRFGIVTLCSPNTTDLSANHLTIPDVLGKGTFLAANNARRVKNDVDANVSKGTSPIFIGSVFVACVTVCILFLIRFVKKRRSTIGSAQNIYRSFNTLSFKINTWNTS